MILLGLPETLNAFKGVKPLLSTNHVKIKRRIVLKRFGRFFHRIAPETAHQGWRYCFGSYPHVHPESKRELLQAMLPDYEPNPIIIEIEENLKLHLLDDLTFWHKFAEAYVKQFGEIWLCHYDPKVITERHSLIETTIDEWNEDHFLKLQCNDTIVIRKRE